MQPNWSRVSYKDECCGSINVQCIVGIILPGNKGPVHICSRYTRPRQNVLRTSSRYTSVQIASTVKCSRYPFVQIWNRHTSRSAQYDLLCIHCATCEVILTCTLRADSGLRAKPRPLRTCSRFHIVQTSFRRRTKGAICSENMLWPCSSWNCSSANTTL